jgi:UDP-glucose 4-epimerase
MRILVTGGSGFLGRQLLRQLRDHEVVALTRGRQAADPQLGHVRWLPMDLSAGLDVSALPATADAIIHLAQSDRYREFPAGAADVFRVNVEVPAALMRWAVDAGVSRAVFASTGTVYEPFTGPLREDAAVNPTGLYGASKLAAETLTLAYQSKIAVAQLRVFFLYGPSQTNMMISRMVDNVRNGVALTLPRTGDGIEFVPTYVDDTARVFAQAVEQSWRGIWNVASPHRVSFRRLAEVIGSAVGRPPVFTVTEQTPPTPIVPDLAKLASRVDVGGFKDVVGGIAATVARSSEK